MQIFIWNSWENGNQRIFTCSGLLGTYQEATLHSGMLPCVHSRKPLVACSHSSRWERGREALSMRDLWKLNSKKPMSNKLNKLVAHLFQAYKQHSTMQWTPYCYWKKIHGALYPLILLKTAFLRKEFKLKYLWRNRMKCPYFITYAIANWKLWFAGRKWEHSPS